MQTPAGLSGDNVCDWRADTGPLFHQQISQCDSLAGRICSRLCRGKGGVRTQPCGELDYESFHDNYNNTDDLLRFFFFFTEELHPYNSIMIFIYHIDGKMYTYFFVFLTFLTDEKIKMIQ